jgi:hypothetical protein
MTKPFFKLSIAMTKAVLILVLIQSSINLVAQTVLLEQRSVDFFFDAIFKDKYKNQKVVEFSGYTMDELSDFKLYENCFKENDSIYFKLREEAFNKKFDKRTISTSEITNISFKKVKIKSAKRLKMRVWLVNEMNDKYYVLIEIIKQYSYTNAYMFELGRKGEILRWCTTGMIH